jgi:hypothetical protein
MSVAAKNRSEVDTASRGRYVIFKGAIIVSAFWELLLRSLQPTTLRRPAVVLALVACAFGGCGGGGGSQFMVPISVALGSSTIVVSQDGKPTHVQITIMSSSETALVSFRGIPGGVQTLYTASDTNPSGALTFTAATTASAGTYMPAITVNSAGQTATVTFTLIVVAATKGG